MFRGISDRGGNTRANGRLETETAESEKPPSQHMASSKHKSEERERIRFEPQVPRFTPSCFRTEANKRKQGRELAAINIGWSEAIQKNSS
ncbi:hypothetical protein Q7C36_011000 [Tachysurus vachellii]|uniref:Uncharacterized protein n=1 Tax=Tachysurus vachellii TaxID=175792 RepID=A0AA88MZB3_TACVA|nr:hypothetical protein Q7C36_011000 [Tachysurus vachellii]